MSVRPASAAAQWSLVVLLGWLGATGLTADGGRAVQGFLDSHALLGGWFDEGGTAAPRFAGWMELFAAGLLASGSYWRRGIDLGAGLAVVLTAIPLTLLLTNPVWIEELGGFPAIGAGQGLIKYLAPAGLSLFLLAEFWQDARLERYALGVVVAGIMLPLAWIGAMKFTEIEARGIEPLLASSPFFGWMLSVFELRTASVLIGVTELATAGLLAMWWVRPGVARMGALLAGVTFAGTLSFMFTLPGWHGTVGFPALSGSGVFLIKDVTLLAASLVLWLVLSEQAAGPESA